MSLSDKIGRYEHLHKLLKVEDVREFIKELKAKPRRITYQKWINKLAGEKLI